IGNDHVRFGPEAAGEGPDRQAPRQRPTGTEDASPPYRCVHRYDDARVVVGWTLIAALMWAVAVEVSLVGGQQAARVPFVVDQHVVGALPAYAADEPFCVAVGSSRRPHLIGLLSNTLFG